MISTPPSCTPRTSIRCDARPSPSTPAWPTTATSSASTAWPARWATCTRPRCYAGDRGELCDLRADPEELVNRFDRPKYRDWQQALRAAIARFLIRYPLPPQPGRNHFFG